MNSDSAKLPRDHTRLASGLAVSLALILCSSCSREAGQVPASAITSVPQATVRDPTHAIDLADVVRPEPSTKESILNEMRARRFPLPPSPQADIQMGPTATLDISNGDVQLYDGNLSYGWTAILDLSAKGRVWFGKTDAFAQFELRRPGGFESSVFIRMQMHFTKSILIDCRVRGPETLVFQFEQSDGWGPWINKAVVTPANGHVFYGVGPFQPPGSGVPHFTTIRLQPTLDFQGVSTWEFFGCDLTMGP
jgi:hypothetical protein